MFLSGSLIADDTNLWEAARRLRNLLFRAVISRSSGRNLKIITNSQVTSVKPLTLLCDDGRICLMRNNVDSARGESPSCPSYARGGKRIDAAEIFLNKRALYCLESYLKLVTFLTPPPLPRLFHYSTISATTSFLQTFAEMGKENVSCSHGTNGNKFLC